MTLDYRQIDVVISDFDLLNKSRKRELVYKRFFLANFLHKHGLGWTLMGRILDKDHASMIYAVEQHEKLTRYSDYKELTKDVKDALQYCLSDYEPSDELGVNEMACLVAMETRIKELI